MPESWEQERLMEAIDRLAGIPGDSGQGGASFDPEAEPELRAAAQLAQVDWSPESRQRARLRALWAERSRVSTRPTPLAGRLRLAAAWGGRLALAAILLVFLFSSIQLMDQASHQGWATLVARTSATPEQGTRSTPLVSMPDSTPAPQGTPAPRPTLLAGDGELPTNALNRLGIGTAQTLAVTGDGAWLAVGSSIGVCLYDTTQFHSYWCVSTPGVVTQLAFDASQKRLLAGTQNGWLTAWEPSAHTQIFSLQISSQPIRVLAWSLDGTRFAVASGAGDLTIRDAENGQAVINLAANRPEMVGLAWSANSERLASLDRKRTLTLWNTQTGKQETSFDTQTVSTIGHTPTALAWTPDGSLLVIASGLQAQDDDRGEITTWNAATGKLIRESPTGSSVNCIALSGDGTQVASLQANGRAILWDLQSGHMLLSTTGWNLSTPALGWSGNASRLYLIDPSGQITAWNTSDNSKTAVLRGYTGAVVDLAWSRDTRYLAASYLTGQLVLWNPTTGQKIRSWNGVPTESLRLAWNPSDDVDLLAIGSDTVTIWNMATGNPTLALEGNLTRVTALAWSPAHWQLAAAGSTGALYIWDPNTGQVLQHLETGHEVTGLAWSPDEKMLGISWRKDDTGGIDVYDIQTWKPIESFSTGPGVSQIGWSPDGKYFGAVSGGWVNVWDASTQELLYRLGEGHSWGVQSFAWMPDSKRVASAAGEVFLWELRTLRKTDRLVGHTEGIVRLAFHPDGKALASGSSDGTVIVWSLTR